MKNQFTGLTLTRGMTVKDLKDQSNGQFSVYINKGSFYSVADNYPIHDDEIIDFDKDISIRNKEGYTIVAVHVLSSK